MLKTNLDAPVATGAGLIVLDVVINNSDSNYRFSVGGSCGNVLTILAYLGWLSYPIANVGEDNASEMLLKDMSRWGTKTDFVFRQKLAFTPIVVERIKNGGNKTHIFEFKCPFCGSLLPRNRPLPKFIAEKLTNKLPKSDVFYFDRVSNAALSIAKTQKSRGAVIVFEPHRVMKRKLFKESLEIADIVKYSAEQIEIMNPKASAPLEIQTMGARGLRYRLSNEGRVTEWKRMDAFRSLHIVDSAGAGDWCTAGLIHCLGQKGAPAFFEADNAEIEKALMFGQCLAALKCAYEGPRGIMYYVNKDDLDCMVNECYLGKTFENGKNLCEIEEIPAPKQVCPYCREDRI